MPMTPLVGDGATALEVIHDALAAAGYGTPQQDLFMGLELDGEIDSSTGTNIPDAITVLQEEDGIPTLTMGRPVALENPRIQVIMRGAPGDYLGPKRRAVSARYYVAALSNYTARGVTMQTALPLGSVLPLGKDPAGRHRFSINFTAVTEPTNA